PGGSPRGVRPSLQPAPDQRHRVLPRSGRVGLPGRPGRPRAGQRKSEMDPVRAWTAGCASGEEACSVAMVLAEALGVDVFRQRVKIYATDVDESALAQARLGSYAARDIQDVPERFRDKYFDLVGDRYVFKPDLRRCVIFGRHDLVQDAPISRL